MFRSRRWGAVTLAAGGTLRIDGTLDLGGGTLSLGAASSTLLFNYLKNGTINEQGGTIVPTGQNNLDGVTVIGTLFGNGSQYGIEDGLTVKTAAGAAGTIDLTKRR